MTTTDAHAIAHPFDDADIRLIVSDMDGTLLDERGAVPERLWGQLERLRERGIVFAPASGRQYAALHRLFERAIDGMCVIADNGSIVVQDGEVLSSVTLERDGVAAIVRTLRQLAADGADLGVVLCGRHGAAVERGDERFLAEAGEYFADIAVVDDLLAHDDEVLKLAVLDFHDPAAVAAGLSAFQATHQIVVSSDRWVDVMSHDVDKGVAVRALQRRLGVTPAQTAVFGDFLNDLQMLDAAEHSFAMANAHPTVAQRARHRAGSNVEHGVVEAIERLLAR
ncbi:HAD family hydrolase [Agrococcus sp. SGAir0287]|uniref:HAD family hydrolase n=1 Tax=Agrococcus sp. SGAir0287 TaxID=2070347 RepID=UPI0010CD12A8|nr:HAD family hydrolase [Agrococcus sp. SGAir0287]QCR20528.1 HAD family hydrolase [Agrococcus sp. SGAir0287]